MEKMRTTFNGCKIKFKSIFTNITVWIRDNNN